VESFAERLQRLRLGRGYTVAGLARAVDVSEGAIRQLESGMTKSPSFHVGLHLALVLGVDPFVLGYGSSASRLDRAKLKRR
jgi:transcriptional regulator with XRE-family HTH domain